MKLAPTIFARVVCACIVALVYWLGFWHALAVLGFLSVGFLALAISVGMILLHRLKILNALGLRGRRQ